MSKIERWLDVDEYFNDLERKVYGIMDNMNKLQGNLKCTIEFKKEE